MYLKKLTLENVGPIPSLDLDLPFNGDGTPKPVVLVGANGSGKTTAISFIANALIAFKQQVFEDTEIEANRVYRIRSRLFLRGGASYYHAKLQFENEVSLEEWVLDRPRPAFEADVKQKPSDDGWRQVPENDNDCFVILPASQAPPFGTRPEPKLARLLSENVALYFPSDRFEPPDWLNQKSLSVDLQFPEPVVMKGFTARRILSRSLLKSTLDWLQAVLLDHLLQDRAVIRVPAAAGRTTDAFVLSPGKNSALFKAASQVLAQVLGAEDGELSLGIENRNARRFTVTIRRNGQPDWHIPNVLSLSAGQSALFCLFCNIIRDFDLAGAPFEGVADIRGIVVIDEADLHLHLDLQYRVLPQLMKLFPKVQFIVTAHSPLFVMGMKNAFTEDGFCLVDMPAGQQISTEAYSEFVQAFEAFGSTKKFQEKLLLEVRKSAIPLVLVEGKHDKGHLENAWAKLHPGEQRPFDILSCGDDGTGKTADKGGAKRLNNMLEVLGRFEHRACVGLFDNDCQGAGQHRGLLEKQGFEAGVDELHKKHRAAPVHALLLPTPPGREVFVPKRPAHRVLELEHYFSDAFLDEHGAKDDPVIEGASAFPIRDSAKAALVEASASAPAAEFSNFGPLLDRLLALLGLSTPERNGQPA